MCEICVITGQQGMLTDVAISLILQRLVGKDATPTEDDIEKCFEMIERGVAGYVTFLEEARSNKLVPIKIRERARQSLDEIHQHVSESLFPAKPT